LEIDLGGDICLGQVKIFYFIQVELQVVAIDITFELEGNLG
jgi:hypothetical protein